MIFRIFFCLFFLSSCNKYIGTIEENYKPTNNIIPLNNVKLEESSNQFKLLNSSIPNSKNLFDLPLGNLNSGNLNLVEKLFKANSLSNFLIIEDKIFFINKNRSLMLFTDGKLQKINEIPKNKNQNYISEYSIQSIAEIIYIFSDYGDIYTLDQNENINFIKSIEKIINSSPIIYDNKILFVLTNGDLLFYDIFTKKIIVSDRIQSNFGYTFKKLKPVVIKNLLFYTFNNNTYVLIDLKYQKIISNFILDTVNILSSIGDINNLSGNPIILKDSIVLISKYGKIINFKLESENIIWQSDISKMVIQYIQYSNSIIFLTNDEIIILDISNGALMKRKLHTIIDPKAMSIVNNNIMILGENTIGFINLNKINNESIKKIKITNNDLSKIGYKSGKIYLSDDNSIYKISE